VIDWNKELSPKVQSTIIGIALLCMCVQEFLLLRIVVGALRADGWRGVLTGAGIIKVGLWLPYASMVFAVLIFVSAMFALARRRAFSEGGLGSFHFILLFISLNSLSKVFFQCLDANHRLPTRPVAGDLHFLFLLGLGTWIVWGIIVAFALGQRLKVATTSKECESALSPP